MSNGGPMKEALIAAVRWWEAVEAVRNDSGREVVFGRDYQPSWLEQAQRALREAANDG